MTSRQYLVTATQGSAADEPASRTAMNGLLNSELQHEHGDWAMPTIEITLEELQTDYDWSEVFGEGSGGNCDGTIQVVPPGAEVDSSGVSRAMVDEVIAAVNGENDGDQWVGLFRLKDGRFLVAEGGCDYTGWDGQAGNSLCVAGNREDAVRLGLNEEQRTRLGLAIQ